MLQRSVINPPTTIGVLGNGQLGRMIALGGRTIGCRCAVLGPGGRASPAGEVALWAEDWGLGDGSAISDAVLEEFCEIVSVVLVEWENVSPELVERIERKGIPVRPSSRVLRIGQNRMLEKQTAHQLGILVPQHRAIEQGITELDLNTPLERDSILKTQRGGYDGRGQVRIAAGVSIRSAWEQLGYVPCILEEVVPFVFEMSVIVARSPHVTPNMVVYGPFENCHENGILRTTMYPVSHSVFCQMPRRIRVSAVSAARKIAKHLDVHGLLAVEFFVTERGEVIFNEIAPRPHNSGHLTIEGFETSQFVQYVRAACNLPFGSMRVRYPRLEMENILGHEIEKWKSPWPQDGLSVHLYGKTEARDGRKMGHVTRYWKE